MSSPHPTASHATFDALELTLGIPSFNNNAPPPPAPQMHQNQHLAPPQPPALRPFVFRSLPTAHIPPQVAAARPHEAPPRRQKQSSRTGKGKSETIPPPYPWATDKRCGVHTYSALKGQGRRTITGRVKCRKCERSYEMGYDLDKFVAVASFLASNKERLKHRAPDMWLNPALPECAFCRQKNAVRPEIEGKKKSINWLFLFLGQMLGCCTGGQLKYFCKHNGHHRTAAKDRLLYLAYLGMCKQLDPIGPFDLTD